MICNNNQKLIPIKEKVFTPLNALLKTKVLGEYPILPPLVVLSQDAVLFIGISSH